MDKPPVSFIEEILNKAGIEIDTTPLKVSYEPQSHFWNELVEKLVSNSTN